MPFTYKPLQARVQFDFDGEEENGELTIREGDVITVTCQVSPKNSCSSSLTVIVVL